MRKVLFVFSVCLFSLILFGCAESSAGSEFILDTGGSAADTEGSDLKEPASRIQQEDVGSAVEKTPSSVEETPDLIVVHVCGAVRNEGVYTLPAKSRIYEAVAAAGGFSENADTAAVNQAQILSDGTRLRIPTQEESSTLAQGMSGEGAELSYVDGGLPDGASDTQAKAGGKININTADEKTLCELNGVGPGTAAKIIAYREANGRFSVIEDIMKVPGIKEKVFSKIKDDITV